MQYTEDEIKKILEDHRRWIDDEEGGARADLCGADLYGADLYGANLGGADLRAADLRSADLRSANLRSADLYDANLYDANLRSANLRSANLGGANLYGATMNWNSHTLISELLWRYSESIEQEMFAAYVGRKTGWCWGQWLQFDHPALEWALQTLAQYVKEGDGAPECVTKRRVAAE